MFMLLKIIYESIVQAFQQLVGNKLRTFLSLLGITIGIFCVIAVTSAVDSLEYSLKQSFKQLGEDVLYLDKYDWGPKTQKQFEEQRKRPRPDFADYEAIQELVSSQELVNYSVFFFTRLVEFGSSSIDGAVSIASTEDFAEIFNVKFENGRYFSQREYSQGMPVVVLGHDIAENLFGENIDPIGKKIKILGHKVQVVGIIEKSGDVLFTPIPFDTSIILPYSYAIKITNAKTNKYMGRLVNIKPREGVSMEQTKDDIIGALRARRKLPPREKNNFALNNLSIIENALGEVFGVIGLVSWIIGGFAMLVGMFSVANIMFVSVKERTNIIGIKKALGAKQYVILMEFLIESVILCLIGGAIGLLIVYAGTKAATAVFGYTIFLSTGNILLGVGVSIVTGIISGIIPASQAAKMDPVVAMRG